MVRQESILKVCKNRFETDPDRDLTSSEQAVDKVFDLVNSLITPCRLLVNTL